MLSCEHALSRAVALSASLTKCALCLSLRYALRVHESRMCECMLCVCMFCERVLACVYWCMRACRFRWLLFGLFFFFCSVSSASPRCQTKKDAEERSRKQFRRFSLLLFIFLFNLNVARIALRTAEVIKFVACYGMEKSPEDEKVKRTD